MQPFTQSEPQPEKDCTDIVELEKPCTKTKKYFTREQAIGHAERANISVRQFYYHVARLKDVEHIELIEALQRNEIGIREALQRAFPDNAKPGEVLHELQRAWSKADYAMRLEFGITVIGWIWPDADPSRVVDMIGKKVGNE
jgi:hypothetical protein